jgi:TRAP-type mannitol/chloroaromatic compound transport system permease small subunit
MFGFMRAYIRWVDTVNYRIGRVAMYGIFVLIGILLWSSLSKVLSDEPFHLLVAPSNWTLEMAQFAMVAYYIIGGPYSIQMGSNVRMDLFYGDWSVKKKAWFDAFTIVCLVTFLAVLLYGGMTSLAYSLGYWGDHPFQFFIGLITGSEEVGRLEVSRRAWRPYMWPIKAIMVAGIVLMLLQAVSEFFKDIFRIRGEEV